MLKKRLIIALLINDGVLFRSKQFELDYRYTLNFVDISDIDELFVIDVTRGGNRIEFLKVLRQISDEIMLPMTVGGGIDSVEYATQLMHEYSVDKLVINTALWNAGFIDELAKKFGSQAVVASLDYRTGDRAGVYTQHGSRLQAKHLATWAVQFEHEGAGELLLQSINLDGSLTGYDLKALALMKDLGIKVPVTIAGGCGNWQHMRDAFREGADGCVTTNIHHFSKSAICAFKENLAKEGIPVRAVSQ